MLNFNILGNIQYNPNKKTFLTFFKIQNLTSYTH